MAAGAARRRRPLAGGEVRSALIAQALAATWLLFGRYLAAT